MRILFIGDVVGKPGRQAVTAMLPELRMQYSPDMIIANGENAAGGIGITRETALDMFHSGVNIITLGNHAWSKRDVYSYLDSEPRIVRPANYPPGAPGRGWTVYSTKKGECVGIINLCGRVFMEALENPFRLIDRILESLVPETDIIFIDFHGEATSEKIAFAWHVDGRAGVVVGTHTHVQTADERILPGGTAYITDVGMTGPMDSVIGVKKELIINRFLTQMPDKFEIAGGDCVLSAVVIDVDSSTGMATNIERISREYYT